MKKKESAKPPCSHPENPRPHRAARAGRIVRTITQGTILAAGLAAAQLGSTDDDPKYPVFSKTLVDKLQAPISRYHE
jgi:hypothetical protein